MSVRLDMYLVLERVMLELDEAGDPLADQIRDLMDPVWYGLTDEDHAVLDVRTVSGVTQLHPVRFPAGTDVFLSPGDDGESAPLERISDTKVGRTFRDWETAA